jgi:hypothetical protein
MPEGPVSLDAGLTLNISGPKGSQQLTATSPGQYFRQLSYLVTQLQYLGPGDYVIDNGAGGADVGPFRATLTIPPPFTSSLERSSGTVRIRWSGGDPSGYVLIQGAGAATAGGLNANFVCAERVAAGQFVIPPEVLLSLPPDPSGRDIAVAVSSPVTTIFRAPGLDIGQFSYFSFLN